MLLSTGLAFALSRFVASSLGERKPGAVAGLVHYGWRVAVPRGAARWNGAGRVRPRRGGAGVRPGYSPARLERHHPDARAAGGPQWLSALARSGRNRPRHGRRLDGRDHRRARARLGHHGHVRRRGRGRGWGARSTVVLTRRTIAAFVGRAREEKPPIREMLGFAGVATAGVTLTVIVWRRSEFVFLDVYSSDAEIGFYSLAFAVVAALAYAPSAVAGTLLRRSRPSTARGACRSHPHRVLTAHCDWSW